jgi:anthranilate synthase component 2
MSRKILLIDNYDSFTFNLVHYLEKAGDVEVDVITNDHITVQKALMYDKIMISPGPGLPSQSGNLMPVLNEIKEQKDILGICLGLQAITESEGGKLIQLKNVFHGVSVPVNIISEDVLFKNIPSVFRAGRYHSWAAGPNHLPSCFEVTAIDENQIIMAIKHKTKKIRALQFHPESILTEYGERIIENWINS